jgi:hypothetical protein
LLYGYAVFQTQNLRRLLDDAGTRLVGGREQLMKLGGDLGGRSHTKALEDELARLEFQLKQREALLANIDANAGADRATLSPYLVALARRSTEGVWLTGIAISGGASSLTLKGRALDADRVPAYLSTLNRETVMQGRRVAELALAAKDAGLGATPAAPPPGAVSEPPRYIEFTMSLSAPGVSATKPKGAS